MNVTFCDRCGIECEHGSVTFNPRIHVVEEYEGKSGSYVDPDGVSVSGRSENYDLCHKCYNVVMLAAMKVFKNFETNE